ncbi:hypothetical protein [Modicisalibacter xianhensis]|uniref:Uncharacterized protein n=1 Tax=Modicisalibacter xianhensis TaxID=442341 RepID=A0A1I3ERY9_9GAMM|nr:hypothetical protein [Halomonas xianhensis]SFI01744.1 hypothetical protein SAMN04487959_114143 [Halomonas xianhensis]
MPVTFAPPYDSPIETRFVELYINHADDDVTLTPQHATPTLCGNFICDFLLATPDGRRVGIECDGREFHDPSRDEWRDAMILGERHLDAIYRIRGTDINHRMEDVLYLLASLEPQLFHNRALANLEVMASEEVKKASEDVDQDFFHYRYRSGIDEGRFCVERRSVDVPPGQRRFWQAAYRYADSIGGGQLDEVIARYRGDGIL